MVYTVLTFLLLILSTIVILDLIPYHIYTREFYKHECMNCKTDISEIQVVEMIEIVGIKKIPKNVKKLNSLLNRNLNTLSYISYLENNTEILSNKTHFNEFLSIKNEVQNKVIDLSKELTSSGSRRT